MSTPTGSELVVESRYHYWTRKARGKTVGLKLTEDELVLYREWIANNRELERIVRKCAISLRERLHSQPEGKLHDPASPVGRRQCGPCRHRLDATSRSLTVPRLGASGKETRVNARFRKRLK